jgi:hypothetical protein
VSTNGVVKWKLEEKDSLQIQARRLLSSHFTDDDENNTSLGFYRKEVSFFTKDDIIHYMTSLSDFEYGLLMRLIDIFSAETVFLKKLKLN